MIIGGRGQPNHFSASPRMPIASSINDIAKLKSGLEGAQEHQWQHHSRHKSVRHQREAGHLGADE